MLIQKFFFSLLFFLFYGFLFDYSTLLVSTTKQLMFISPAKTSTMIHDFFRKLFSEFLDNFLKTIRKNTLLRYCCVVEINLFRFEAITLPILIPSKLIPPNYLATLQQKLFMLISVLVSKFDFGQSLHFSFFLFFPPPLESISYLPSVVVLNCP